MTVVFRGTDLEGCGFRRGEEVGFVQEAFGALGEEDRGVRGVGVGEGDGEGGWLEGCVWHFRRE